MLWVAVALGCGGGGDQTDGGDDAATQDGATTDGPSNGDGAADSGSDAPIVISGADPTFAGGGIATKNFNGQLAGVVHVARQSDGSIVAIGGSQESILLERVKSDGSMDTTFGNAGVVQFPWGLVTNGVTGGTCDVAIQADGKIVAAARVYGGIASPIMSHSVTMRLMPDGSFDKTFAGTGLIMGDPKLSTANNSVVLTSKGSIVVGGSDLRRYDSSGALDATFGNAGIVINTIVQGLAIQPDDSIIVVELNDVSRWTSAGKIDTTFGTNGHTLLPGNYCTQLYAASVQPDGKILVAGSLRVGSSTQSDFGVARLTSTGAIDTTFGTNGYWTDGYTQSQSIAFGVATQSDGHVLLSGTAIVNNSVQHVVRLSSSGVYDSTYSASGGAGFTDFGNLVVGPNDEATTGGAVLSGFTFTPALVRFTATGGGDPGFNAKLVGFGSFDRAHAVAFQPDGHVILAGEAGGQLGAARFGADGSQDSSFSTTTGNFYSANTIVVQSSGKIVIGGFGGFSSPHALTRYDGTTGALDKTFGTNGIASMPSGLSESFALDAAGNMIVTGTTNASGHYEFDVVRFTPDGAVDTTFGTAGVGQSAYASTTNVNIGMYDVVQQDGKIVVLGATGPSSNSNSAKLVRFTANGTFDATFGGTGTVDVSAGSPTALAQQSDGKLVAVSMGMYGSSPLVISRYTPDGAVDGSFGSSGAATFTLGGNDYYGLYTPMGLAIASDGKILVGLASSSDALVEKAVLIRLGTDGKADTSFGTNGQMTLDLGNGGSSSINALAFDPNGKLLVVGRAWNATNSDFYALRMIL